MPLKLKNKETGQIILEENDAGQMTIHDPSYKEAYDKAAAIQEAGRKENRPPGTVVTPGEMKIDDQKQAYYGHNLLHGWFNGKPAEGWTDAGIKKEHSRVVQAILNKDGNHIMKDSLDDSLAEGLKSKSTTKKDGQENSNNEALITTAHAKVHEAFNAVKESPKLLTQVQEMHVNTVVSMVAVGVDHPFRDDLDEYIPDRLFESKP